MRQENDRRDGFARASLGQAFLAAIVAIVVVVALAFGAFLSSSRASILAASDRQRSTAAHRIEGQVAASLGRAEAAVGKVERAIHSGATDPDDPERLEALLYTELTDSPGLEEVTFTRAHFMADEPDGSAHFDMDGRRQISVQRAPDGHSVTRDVRRDGKGFTVYRRDRAVGEGFVGAAFVPAGIGADPTLHPTFSVIAGQALRGRAIWSDLHFSELDGPVAPQRVVLSVQRAIDDAAGHFAGVARVALLTTDLDAIVKGSQNSAPEDPHRVALLAVSSDGVARLVARVSPDDRVESMNGELRVVSAHPPREIAALLGSPLSRGLDPTHPRGGGVLDLDGERYLATLEELSVANGGTMGWLAAVIVPEAHYTQDLVRLERMLLFLSGGTLALVVAIGAVTLGVIRGGLRDVTRMTARMRSFDFSPSQAQSRIVEIDEVKRGLERAKTVSRAMGKYVPLDLVRRLYESNEEPTLGGELAELSILFSDIEGFTSLSERLAPDALAERLGLYLERMTVAITRTGGTIDKYIGDAVMAFWNAPVQVSGHAARACEAVLDCKAALAELYASPQWEGLPALVTRFGVHEARVLVGHFGAPTRLSYTVLGDGVNLAARLEPLCKQYGVTALVSEPIALEAKNAFHFRRIDRVAVKGKAKGIDVYELLGRRGESIGDLDRAERYEEAFALYLSRDFSGAIELLGQQPDDSPSQVLLARCTKLKDAPPPPDWDGVHVAASK